MTLFGVLKQEPVQVDDRDTLRRMLSEPESGGIIFTTVQKFALLNDESGHPVLNDRHTETRPTAASTAGKPPSRKTAPQVRLRPPHARCPAQCLVHRLYRHPQSRAKTKTPGPFGDYVSIYDIQDAVDDGATVPIFYESRLAKLDINREQIEELSDQVEEVARLTRQPTIRRAKTSITKATYNQPCQVDT